MGKSKIDKAVKAAKMLCVLIVALVVLQSCSSYQEPLKVSAVSKSSYGFLYTASYQHWYGTTVTFHSEQNLSIGDTVKVVKGSIDTSKLIASCNKLDDTTVGQIILHWFQ
jgi:hypothetical protein